MVCIIGTALFSIHHSTQYTIHNTSNLDTTQSVKIVASLYMDFTTGCHQRTVKVICNLRFYHPVLSQSSNRQLYWAVMRGKLKYPIYRGLRVIFAKKEIVCASQGGKRGYYSIKKMHQEQRVLLQIDYLMIYQCLTSLLYYVVHITIMGQLI